MRPQLLVLSTAQFQENSPSETLTLVTRGGGCRLGSIFLSRGVARSHLRGLSASNELERGREKAVSESEKGGFPEVRVRARHKSEPWVPPEAKRHLWSWQYQGRLWLHCQQEGGKQATPTGSIFILPKYSWPP